MENWSNERKRQYVLEQVIMQEKGIINRLFTELRWKYEEDDGTRAKMVKYDDVESLRIGVIDRLSNLLASVIATYSKE